MAGGFAWQTQVVIALMALGGGYLLWVNKLPPFNKGGAFENFTNLFPNPKDFADGSGPIGSEGDAIEQDLPQGGPSPGGSAKGPSLNGPPVPPFQSSYQSDPSVTDFSVYQNYAMGLAQQYGQGNQPNLGGGNQPLVVGDPNLGTTPVPGSLFGMNGSQGSSQPPPFPFLPNPTQYPGPLLNSPFPNQFGPAMGPMGGPPMPPMMGGPPPMMGPLPPLIFPRPGMPPLIIPQKPHKGKTRRRGIPVIKNIDDIFSIDLGNIHIGMDGIRIGDLINMGVNMDDIFPNGIDIFDKNKIDMDISSYIDKILKKSKASTPSGTSGGGSSSTGGAGGLGNIFGGTANTGGLGNIFGGSGGLGGLFGGGMFGGGNNNQKKITNTVPGANAAEINGYVQNLLKQQGIGFAAFNSTKGTNTMPYIRRRTRPGTRIPMKI